MTDAALDEIAAEGYDPDYGARPLKRVIQQQIQNPLASEILKGRFGEGVTIRVDYRDGAFKFGNRINRKNKSRQAHDRACGGLAAVGLSMAPGVATGAAGW